MSQHPTIRAIARWANGDSTKYHVSGLPPCNDTVRQTVLEELGTAPAVLLIVLPGGKESSS